MMARVAFGGARRCGAEHQVTMVPKRRVDRVRLPKRSLDGDLIVAHPTLQYLARGFGLFLVGLSFIPRLNNGFNPRDFLCIALAEVHLVLQSRALANEDVLGRLEKRRRIPFIRFQLVVDQEELLVVAPHLLVSRGVAPRRCINELLHVGFELVEALLELPDGFFYADGLLPLLELLLVDRAARRCRRVADRLWVDFMGAGAANWRYTRRC